MVGHPSWSPDGHWIVFHARPEGPTDLFLIPAAGGPPKRLTTNSWEDHYPSYSHDGRSIFFSSRRSGELQIWRMAAEGGDAVQITTSGAAHNPAESPDGKAVFYHFIHALGLLVVSFLPKTGTFSEFATSCVCGLLLAGIIFFSGSLYLLAVTGNRWLGAITPIGGVAFIAAWLVLAWFVMRHE